MPLGGPDLVAGQLERLARDSPSLNLLAQDPPKDGENYDTYWPWIKDTWPVYAAIAVLVLFIAICHSRLSQRGKDLSRLAGFVFLHLADYGTNVSMMVYLYTHGHAKYLLVLLPVHGVIGLFCIYTAFSYVDYEKWFCTPLCNVLFLLIVMGFMQGVQLKLALDDYRLQRRLHSEGGDDEMVVPSMMPARFHCKAMDGIFEGTVFAMVAMYSLLKNQWVQFGGILLDPPTTMFFYICAFFSFMTAGLALMEVDYRTSASVQRLLNHSTVMQARHLAFRTSEFSLRLLTVLAFLCFMRPYAQWYIGFVIVGLDYIVGVVMLIMLGGKDPAREASVLLGVPLFVVNVMQFVDTPGMSLQAQRISKVIVPFRLFELACVVAYCTFSEQKSIEVSSLNEGEPIQQMSMGEFLLQTKMHFLVLWLASAFIYIVLLLTYALRVKPEADLHSAVANGEVEKLEALLKSSELVLDVNRYGPDGRTPLHLAAALGQVDCMQLLVEERANLLATTDNRLKNTPLHLAAGGSNVEAVKFLCWSAGGDSLFLNAANAEGDTALHTAARKQNLAVLQELLKAPAIDVRRKNAKGQTAADCAPSDKFGFDRNSPECAIGDLLRQAQHGPSAVRSSMMSQTMSRPMGAAPSSGAAGAAGAATDRSTAKRKSQDGVEMIERSGSGTSGSGSGPSSAVQATDSADADAAGPTESRRKSNESNRVPLQTVPKDQEEEFRRRNSSFNAAMHTTSTGSGRRPSSMQITNCGISSFMLSAGMGALSKAILSSIREDGEMQVSAEPATAPKASLQDFVELRALGEGAFGKVLLVRHKATCELFAMKTMDKAKFKAQKITSKAISEQYILKTTRHPFIVALHYAFQATDFWALVMDYCPNGDLQNYLGKYGDPGMTFIEIARLGGEVLLAVEHLHSIQVIFRDLKLENVVLDADWRAKVTDFGLAKKLYNNGDAKTMCGSYGYAAPEIMLNSGRYTYAVDLYSFGVMMYLMLSGGDPSQNDPRQRLPPMRHSALRRKLRDAEKEPRAAPWAQDKVGGLELVLMLTSEDPRVRSTCAAVKQHRFYRTHLQLDKDRQMTVDDLLNEVGPFPPSAEKRR
eukprot:TRINITY_DN111128_c0_g1_i1.p1 TRINITY_DN111128_c0_g1~~TRINITY_DN111128_c0_g1_i1.p1  ORF type:complete len:1093 (+),score=252.92 TRINITY_DN111128_c0_g1_i1:76-3354(+)